MDVSFFRFLEDLSPWWWVAFGLGLGAVEMLTMSFFLIGPGLAAFVMAILLFVIRPVPGPLQLAIFAALSVALTFAFQALRGRWQSEDGTGTLNDPAARMVGRRGSVVRFGHGEGTVTIDGVHWQARSDPATPGISAGATVTVAGADGTTLIVRPAEEG